MNAAIRFLLVVLALATTSCGPDEPDRDEARIRQEIDRRVAIIRGDLKTAENLWHTVRVSSFCILAGGCLIWLLAGNDRNSSTPRERPRLPAANSYDQAPGRRIIDREHPPYEHEYEDDPYHR